MSKTPTRIYLVRNVHTGKSVLVRGASQAQALRHATKTAYEARVASQDDIVAAMKGGCTVEDAGDQEAA